MKPAYNECHQIIEQWQHTNCLVIGDIMLDHYYNGNVDRISPEAPVPVFEVTKEENRLGGAANVALNLANLGAKTRLLSVIGDDDSAKQLKLLLEEKQLDSDLLILSNSRITTIKNRLIAKNQQLLRFDKEDKKPLSPEDEDLLMKKIELEFKTQLPDVVILQDYNKGVLTPNIIRKITETANDNKIPVIVDPKKENFFSYKAVTLFKPNLKELKVAFNMDGRSLTENELIDLVELCKEKLSATSCMVTLSEGGLYVNGEKQFFSKPEKVRNIADVSGAGDTVLSVTALCYAHHVDEEIMAFLANLSGGIVCEFPGVYPINKQLLLADLKSVC